MNLKRRLTGFLLREQAEAMRDATDALWELWEKRPWLAERLAPTASGRLREALDGAVEVGELDSHTVSAILRRMRYVPLTAAGDDAARLDAVAECRQLWRDDVLTQQIIGLWTDFGYGQVLEIKVEDPDAAKVWEEFWNADRNGPVLKDRRLGDQSDRLLTDGERFWVGFTNEGKESEERPRGGLTLRSIPTEEITELVTDPDDDAVTLFYKREWTPKGQNAPKTLYYPDWEASDEELAEADLPDGALRADEEAEGTDVGVIHFGYRMIDGRGWPLMSAGAAWSRAYRDFMQDRVTLVAAVASYVRKLKITGSDRARRDIQSRIESTLTQLSQYAERNPPAAAGSTWVENQAADLSPFPLRTGASDAQADGAALIAQAGLGGRVFPHYLGRGESFRLATATAMEMPVRRAFRRYQLFWADVWRDLVKFVLRAWEEANGVEFSSYHAEVSTDALVETDVELMSRALGELADRGLVPTEEGMTLALTLLGVPNVEDVMDEWRKEKKEREAGAAAVAPPRGEEEEIMPEEARALAEAAARVLTRR